jgi:hypothetical protein
MNHLHSILYYFSRLSIFLHESAAVAPFEESNQSLGALRTVALAGFLLLPSPCSRHGAVAIHCHLLRNVDAITQAARRPPTSPTSRQPGVACAAPPRQGEVVGGSARKSRQSDSSGSKSSSSPHAGARSAHSEPVISHHCGLFQPSLQRERPASKGRDRGDHEHERPFSSEHP